jgi:ABC-type Zn uptake system ZnuABC Zn-binding protein ZnuA
MPRRLYLLLPLFGGIVLAIFLGISGCSPASHSDKNSAVVTFSVLGDFVHNVAGDHMEVVTLVGPDKDTHTFEPTPEDCVKLANAKIIFENGAGFEPWFGKICESSRTKAHRVTTTKGLKLIKADEEGDHDHKHGSDGHHHEGDDEDNDPHVWHDVNNAKHMVEVIRDALVECDPDHAADYKANSATYLKELEDLDNWVLCEVNTLQPKDCRKLVTNHDTFGYFAKRYEFEIVGSLLGSVSTEAADPSGAAFKDLVQKMKDTKVRAIFAENVENSKIIARLAEEAGVKLAPPLYTDALGKPGTEGETYIKMMRYNVKTIVSNLKP